MPWAVPAETNTLLFTESETRAVLGNTGFRVAAFDDVTTEAFDWMLPQPADPPSGPSLGMIVGVRMGEMVGNFVRNLREGRVRLVMAVCEAV